MKNVVRFAERTVVGGQRNSTARDLALIVMIIAVPVMPMFIYGYHWGHDLDIHLKSWMDVQAQVREGILYPRWASDANYGLGEPRFIFYPPASWMLGGMLGLFLPWRIVPAVFVWLTLIVAAIALRKLAAEWLSPSAALVAGVLYAVNPYMMLSAYTRCAYAEMLAAALFPLLLWGAFRIERDSRKSLIVIAISLAAIWLANLPAGVIATYSFALVLIVMTVLHRSARLLIHGGAAALVGIGLAAFTLVPAAWEKHWVNISAINRPNQLPWANFLFSPEGMPNMYVFNHRLSPLGILIIFAAIISAIAAKRMRRGVPDVWWALTVLCGVSSLMMFRVSTPLWRTLPELRFVQFPWRWFFPLCAAAVLLLAVALQESNRKRALWPLLAVALLAIDGGIVHAREWFPHFTDEIERSVQSHAGYNGLEEYAPLARHTEALPRDAPLIALVDTELDSMEEAPFAQVELWSSEQKVVVANLPHAMTLNFKLLSYPAWKATVNGQPAPLQENSQTGQVMVELPAGLSRTEIKFTRTWDRAVGLAISIGSASALIALWGLLAYRRKLSAAPSETQLVPARVA